MRIIETKVYKYAELSADAQSKARDAYRESLYGDNYFSESVIDDFETVAGLLGWSLNRSRGSRTKKAIYWSGFSSQGDGACFSGSWRARDFNLAKLSEHAPRIPEEKRHINNALQDIADRYAKLAEVGPALGSATANDRYMSTHTEFISGREGSEEELVAEADEFQELANDLAHWLYRGLEAEYEYTMSDAQIIESIEANEYEYTEDGEFV